jgi:hypothetical protein
MKRGISPMVATVLIISLVVVIATILMYSLQSIITNETGDIEKETNTRNSCLFGLDLKIETPCQYNPDPLNSNLSIKIKNYESGDIEGFIFKVTEGLSTYVYENNLGFPGLGSKRYFLGFAGDYSDINEIIVIPKVNTESGEQICNEIVLSMNEVSRCCLDLDGDHIDSCNATEPLDTDGEGADCNESDILNWKLWKNVYPDFDLDGETSMFTQVDYCGNDTLDTTYPNLYSLSPGDDCVDNNNTDCNEWYNLHTTPNGPLYETACNHFDPQRQRKGTFMVPPPPELCYDSVDNNCNGQIDVAELGPVCYPTCAHGQLTAAVINSYPDNICRCELSGTMRNFAYPSGSCPYCCGGVCWAIDCNIVPIEL